MVKVFYGHWYWQKLYYHMCLCVYTIKLFRGCNNGSDGLVVNSMHCTSG